jgi:hypothetical protein
LPDNSTPENPLGFRNIKLFCIDAPDLGGPCAFLSLHSPSVILTTRFQALMQLRERGPFTLAQRCRATTWVFKSPPPPPSLTSPPPPVARLLLMGGCTRWVRGSTVPDIALSRLGCNAPPPPPSFGGVYPPSPCLTSPPPPVDPASGIGGGCWSNLRAIGEWIKSTQGCPYRGGLATPCIRDVPLGSMYPEMKINHNQNELLRGGGDGATNMLRG